MKKLIVLCLVFVFALSMMVGCGGSNEPAPAEEGFMNPPVEESIPAEPLDKEEALAKETAQEEAQQEKLDKKLSVEEAFAEIEARIQALDSDDIKRLEPIELLVEFGFNLGKSRHGIEHVRFLLALVIVVGVDNSRFVYHLPKYSLFRFLTLVLVGLLLIFCR